MNRLIAELQRLYFLPGQQWLSQASGDGGTPACCAGGVVTPEIVAGCLEGETTVALDLAGPDGSVRAMAVVFERAADWEQVARLYQGVQEDLDLPAPAISVSGRNGYQLWFSLADSVPVEQARVFLDALRLRYLADLPLAHVKFRPDIGEPASAGQSLLVLAPARHGTSGKWSAFIDPSMGGMFMDGPWLEMAPNPDKQADLLAGFESVKAEDFQRVLNLLQPPAEPAGGRSERSASEAGEVAGQTGTPAGRSRSKLQVGTHFSDPKSFLLAVMNDPSASAGQRIKAAKALLPYFHKSRT